MKLQQTSGGGVVFNPQMTVTKIIVCQKLFVKTLSYVMEVA